MSGNRCAFPRCESPLVDPSSGSIIGEICHIKGEKPGAKRYNENQPNRERQAFENLILMCGSHHKVIDDDDKTYTVQKLVQAKKKHERGQPCVPPLTDRQAAKFISKTVNYIDSSVSVVETNNQSGGQTAHTINNFTHPVSDEDSVQVDGNLTVAGSLKELQRVGCPGLVLTVVCRSIRAAKIRKALLCVEGRGFLAAYEGGFGAEFGYDPPKGLETETMFIELLPLSKPDSSEGFVLERDDVKRFYLPIAVPSLGVYLTSPKDNLSVRVEFFDGSERSLITGEEVQSALRGLFEAHGEDEHKLHVTIKMGLRVNSKSLPRGSKFVGQTNPNPVSLVDAALNQPPGTAQGQKVQCGLLIASSSATHERTVCLQVLHVGGETINELSAAFVSGGSATLPMVEGATGPLPPGGARAFALPFRAVPELQRVVGTQSTDDYAILVRSEKEELWRLPGTQVQRLVASLDEVPQAQESETQANDAQAAE